jgi:hypothetical protein
MSLFDAPDYIIGNSATIQTQLAGVLTTLDQALEALEPAPNATTVKFNNTVLCDAGTAGKTTSIADGSIVINNNTGGTSTPVITLNQTGSTGGLLKEEIYNQRTAQTGEFNRMSFYAKNNATPTQQKIEYARIHQNAPIIGVGSERGRLDLAVRDAGGITDYMILNGSTTGIDIFKNTNFHNTNLNNIANITNNNSMVYKPSQNYVCNSITQTILPPTSTGEQIFAFSEGITNFAPSYNDPAPTINPAPNTNTFASVLFANNNLLIIANGQRLYNWDTGTNAWVNFYSFDANINCMAEIGGYLYVGGEFLQDLGATTTFNRIARVDGGLNVLQILWSNRSSDIGFNDSVFTLCSNDTFSSWLYVGGRFTQTGGGIYDLNRFGCIESNNLDLYSIDDNSGSAINGFDNNVRTISCSADRIFIGGQFTSQSASFSGVLNNTSNQRAVVWTSNDYQSTSATEFETVGSSTSSINDTVFTSVKDPFLGIFHFGGDFTNLDGAFSYLGWCSVSTPASVGFTTFFTQPCYSVLAKAGAPFVYAKEGNTTGALHLVNQIVVLSATTPSGVMTGCFDFANLNLFTFFFSNDTTITAFNPTTTTTIDLTSLGIGVFSGSFYDNRIELNGVGSFFTGVSVFNSSLATPDLFVITSSYSTSFY